MSYMLPPDDKALFLQISQGDTTAFHKVFQRYRAPFHAAAYKMTRSGYIAEEIVQEVFITLWTKRELVAAADNSTHYLFTILYNSIYDHFRKLASERALKDILSQQAAEWEDSPMEMLLQAKEYQQLLDGILGRLPRQQQMAYRLSRLEGMSRTEVASHMRISPHSVKNHLQQAMKFIRLYFKDREAITLFILFAGSGGLF